MEQPEVIKAIQRRHSQLEVEINELKKEFKVMIVDKTIPLENRWRAFTTASAFLKDTHPWCINAKSIQHLLNQHHDGDNIGQVLDCDRHSVVHASDMVNELKQFGWFKLEDEIALKEELLSLNLGSWTYDW